MASCGYVFQPVMWSSWVHSCTWNQNYNWKFHCGAEWDLSLLCSAYR